MTESKKTPTQKYIDQAVKAAAEEAVKSVSPSISIQNCAFDGVKFDAKAVDAIETIAEGLVENAKALGSLAAVLRASNVTIETMVKV